jgi:ribonuclease Z
MREGAGPNVVGRTMTARAALAAALSALALFAGVGEARSAPPKPAAAPSLFRITLLGTGNPRPVPDRFGPSSLVEAGRYRILVDAGRGATIRLLQAGGRDLLGGLDFVLLTHLHSDHTVGLPDLWLTGWISGRFSPLPVYGPPGTESMIRHLQRAYEFDVENRRDAVEKLPAAGAELQATDLEVSAEGGGARLVFDRDGLKILAFPVDHGPDTPAYGYKFEYAGHTAVFSGDCRPTPGLVVQAHGADVLVHEVVVPGLLRRRSLIEDKEAVERVIARHTTPEEAGRIFALTRPRLAVYTHIVPSMATAADLVPPTRKEYGGRLAVGYDLMTITIGKTILLGRRGTAPR